MKIRPICLFLTLLLLLSAFRAAGAEIAVGDRQEVVLARLGKPTGFIGSEAYQVYYFDRGEVVFRDGRVESHTIVSAEEAAQRRAELEAEREAYRQQKREARQQRIAEGKEIRDRKLADPRFAELAPRARLAFWQTFRKKYPEVDVELDYTIALQETRALQAEQMAERERERRLHEMEARAREAEHRTRLAEREAEAARDRHRYRPVRYYRPHPVVLHRKPDDCAPPQKKPDAQPETRHDRRPVVRVTTFDAPENPIFERRNTRTAFSSERKGSFAQR